MKKYLACMKLKRGMNDPECRNLAKDYLTCRMDKYAHCTRVEGIRLTQSSNLMAKDEFKNLGFAEEEKVEVKKPLEDGKKGELQW